MCPAAVPAVLILCFVAGCGDTRTDSGMTVCCGADADPVFLQSKLDDDDGDGNPYDEDFPTINDEDDDIADHAWIVDDFGVYHLFFQNEGLVSGSHIEHYTSTDLQTLDYVGVALSANPAGWDSYALWAPHVIRSGNIYFMFYTGTTGPGHIGTTQQRLGLATSTDLMTWTRYPVNNCPGTTGDGCVYDCDESWTTFSDPPGSFNQQCRDPFVLWDEDGGRWVLFATAKSRNGYGVVTVAYSTDLARWAGAGFVDATRRLASGVGGQPTGGQAENPFVMSHDGVRYLLFTDWLDPEDSVTVYDPRTIVQYATSPSLDADSLGSTNWTYRGYTPDPGVNAIEVQPIGRDIALMSQSISNERSGYWELRRRLRLKCVIWGEDYAFDTWNVKFSCGAPCFRVGPTGPEPPSDRAGR